MEKLEYFINELHTKYHLETEMASTNSNQGYGTLEQVNIFVKGGEGVLHNSNEMQSVYPLPINLLSGLCAFQVFRLPPPARRWTTPGHLCYVKFPG